MFKKSTFKGKDLLLRMDGWMTCDFTSFLTVFQSYQDDVWMIMKGEKFFLSRIGPIFRTLGLCTEESKQEV